MKLLHTIPLFIILAFLLIAFKQYDYSARNNIAASAQVSIADASIVEGNAGQRTVEVIVILSQVTTNPVTIKYNTRDGSASAGSDYAAASGSLSFAKGEMMKKITVLINGEVACEASESFEVVLSNASGAILADSIGKVTITNDDCISGNLSVYEVKFTYVGYTSLFGNTPDCPIRRRGEVVLTGLLAGNENVGRDDDIQYTGLLNILIDIDICSIKPGDPDQFCGMSVVAGGSMKTELEIYFDQRGGYIKAERGPGEFVSAVFGSCDEAQMDEENILVPTNGSIATVFNGLELPMLTMRTLQVGLYVKTEADVEIAVEVIRKIR